MSARVAVPEGCVIVACVRCASLDKCKRILPSRERLLPAFTMTIEAAKRVVVLVPSPVTVLNCLPGRVLICPTRCGMSKGGEVRPALNPDILAELHPNAEPVAVPV